MNRALRDGLKSKEKLSADIGMKPQGCCEAYLDQSSVERAWESLIPRVNVDCVMEDCESIKRLGRVPIVRHWGAIVLHLARPAKKRDLISKRRVQ